MYRARSAMFAFLKESVCRMCETYFVGIGNVSPPSFKAQSSMWGTYAHGQVRQTKKLSGTLSCHGTSRPMPCWESHYRQLFTRLSVCMFMDASSFSPLGWLRPVSNLREGWRATNPGGHSCLQCQAPRLSCASSLFYCEQGLRATSTDS